MKTHEISIPVNAEEAQAYAAATPEEQRKINETIRRSLRVVIHRSQPLASSEDQMDIERHLDDLAARGLLMRAKKPKSEWVLPSQEPVLPEGTVQSLLDEVRADRDFGIP